MKNVLLIRPICNTKKETLDIPLTLLYLSSGITLWSKDIRSAILDLSFEYCRQKKTPSALAKFQEKCIEKEFRSRGPFNIVGISGLCDNFHLTIQLSEFIKNKYHVPVVIGGPHATFIANEVLESFEFIDYVIR